MFSSPVTAALLAALSLEVQPFLRRVKARRLAGTVLPAWEFSGTWGKGLAAVSGMGATASARAAAWIFQQYQPRVLISLGFGGAVTPDLHAGALVIGETYWRYEPEAGALEEVIAPLPPISPQDVLDRLKGIGLPAFLGSVVTTAGIIHKAKQGSPLLRLNHPVLDLETSAAAQAAQARGIPFVALRAVTDTATEEIPGFIGQAAQEGRLPTVRTALAWLAADPRRLLALGHLWRTSRLAGQNLARALEVVLDILWGGDRGSAIR